MTDQNQSLPDGWFETNLAQIIVLSKDKVNPLDLDEIPYMNSHRLKNFHLISSQREEK